MDPSFDGGDKPIRIGGRGDRAGDFVGFCDETIYGGLEIDEGQADTVFGTPIYEFGDASFDGIEHEQDFGVKWN